MAGQKREESSPNTSSTTNNNNKNNASSSSAATPTIGSSVIPIINKLQDILSPLSSDELSKIPLPHVAVVGSQSSGKSSVLEALVGRDFLPRGCEICTRCPLILQLERRDHLQSSNHDQGGGIDIVDHDREWGEFLHMPHSRFYDFAHIRKEIQVLIATFSGSRRLFSSFHNLLDNANMNLINLERIRNILNVFGITLVCQKQKHRCFRTLEI